MVLAVLLEGWILNTSLGVMLGSYRQQHDKDEFWMGILGRFVKEPFMRGIRGLMYWRSLRD